MIPRCAEAIAGGVEDAPALLAREFGDALA